MKFPTLITTFFTLSILSITVTAQAYNEYDPFEAREWTDDVFGRHKGQHAQHELQLREDFMDTLATRELVQELEARLYQRNSDVVTETLHPGGSIDHNVDHVKPGDDHIFHPLPKVYDPKKEPIKSAMKKKSTIDDNVQPAKKKVTFDDKVLT